MKAHLVFSSAICISVTKVRDLDKEIAGILLLKSVDPYPLLRLPFFIALCQFGLYMDYQSITLSCIGSSPSAKSEQGNRPALTNVLWELSLCVKFYLLSVWLDTHSSGDGPVCAWMDCLCVSSGSMRSLLC